MISIQPYIQVECCQISYSSSFVRCNASNNGGGIFALIDCENSSLIIKEMVIFDNCISEADGGF